MKRLLQLAVLALTVIASAISCNKDTTLIYNDATMGDIMNGTFISDQGIIYNIVESTQKFRLDTMTRAFLICDVLSANESGPDSYNVRLKEVYPVVVKPVKFSSFIEDDDALGNDPIKLYDGWISGGYMNFQVVYTGKKDSKTRHLVNMVLDQEKSTDTSLELNLRHNGYGEIMDASNANSGNIVIFTEYYSFPLAGVNPNPEKKAEFNINFPWYREIDNSIYPEVEQKHIVGYIPAQ